MKLVDKMKDESLGMALLYNYTKGARVVEMEVYDIILPLIYNDMFRNALIKLPTIEEAIQFCIRKKLLFQQQLIKDIEETKSMTANALAFAMIGQLLEYQKIENQVCGVCLESAKVLEFNEIIELGKYFQGKTKEEVLAAFDAPTPKIAFLDSETLGEDVDLSGLSLLGDVTLQTTDTCLEERMAAIKDANIIISNKIVLDSMLLAQAKNVELICVTATGYNHVETRYCKKYDITLCNVKGYSTNSVAQHTFALLLSLYNKIPYYHDYIDGGNYSSSSMFSHFDYAFHELDKKTWGIVGMGDIGQKVASIATAFGANVQYYSTSGKNTGQDYPCCDFETLLKTSDIISIHAPFNETTDNLFDKEAIFKMKKGAYLINVGRGKIVNEQAVVDALNEEVLAGVGLDVFENEPFYQESSLLQIKDANRLIMTPHIAWAGVETRNRVIEEVCLNISTYLVGNKRNACK